MRTWKLSAVAVAVAAAFPGLAQAQAASADAVLKELQDLKARVLELEKKLKEAEAKPAAAGGPAGSAQWGMTPEQVQEFNRIAVKTEATEDNLEMWGMKGLTISGYIEPVYIYNKRQDRAGFQFLNSQDDGYFYDTSYMGAAVIDFTKETDSGTRWKLTLSPQRGVGELIGAGPVQEATVSIPLSDLQTRLVVGQMPDWSGYEYQQPTLNPFTTHNLLFDLTLPTGYTGVGVDITRGKWWSRAMLANVNNTRNNQGDKAPALVYRVDYSKGEFNGFGFAGLHGKTTNFNLCADDDCAEFEKTTTHLFEIDGYFIRGDWTVQGQFSYGKQKQAAITPALDADGNPVFRDAEWFGVSGLVGYNITPRLQLLARADYINNDKNGGGLFGYTGYWPEFGVDGAFGDYRNGVGPDGNLDCGNDPSLAGCSKGANRYALTFGMKYAFNQNTTFKAEYRFDGANKAVFYDVKDGTYAKKNHLLGASVVVFF
ncbi:DUF3138 family protein [Caldimonas sp. KR1-144]|uniref:DUF3138 family protein n=1 Tax=Caldimonas sp. KR1-144 TaxID=3400911 RepID=UPI003C028C2C